MLKQPGILNLVNLMDGLLKAGEECFVINLLIQIHSVTSLITKESTGLERSKITLQNGLYL